MNTFVTNQASELRPPTQADTVLTVSSTAVAIAVANLPESHPYVLIQVQDQPVRITYDGSTPTASNGQRMDPNGQALLRRETVAAMQFIRETSTDAKVWAQPFGV